MNLDSILECVPNFSEGHDAAIVRQIVSAMELEGVRLLDYSLDADHNRSVVTIAGAPAQVVEAAIRGAGKAAELIDLTRQAGVHPRIGAADVVPFVPVSGVSLAEAAMLARQAGLQIWRRFGIPVYFYGAAAARPDRVQLEDVRRGQFEGLLEAALRDAARRPDIGGPELHATAGASAVGARSFLIAYNIYLAPSAEISHARAIARDIRGSSGGMHGVKAIGVLAKGRAQVSMNITDFRLTPVSAVHAEVERLALRHGTTIADGELIGLIPAAACEKGAMWTSQIHDFDPAQKILEQSSSTLSSGRPPKAMMAEPLLELAHVNVVRGDRRVLHDIHLRVEHGEQIAILGPNGCGKSTLLKTITCELYPLAAPVTRVRIFGQQRWDLTELKKRLGVVQNELPGRPILRATGEEAVLTGFFSSSTLWPNLVVTPEMRQRAEQVMEQTGAINLRERMFGEMSAGQQRRILIGRALVASSKCLLLDEPSNALDLRAQGELRELLISLAGRGTTILHITHHIADIIPAMKRVILMRDGRIVADGTRQDLLTASALSELFRTEVRVMEQDGIFHAWRGPTGGERWSGA